jgi:tetratricopeptide (TPR) repeat protein
MLMRKLNVAIAGVAAGMAVLLVGALQPVPVRSDESPVTGSTEALEAEVAAGTATGEELAALAIEYLGKVRSDADPTVIPVARELLERSLEVQPEDNFAASLGMASLANARHAFSTSVEWSRRAIRINPYAAAPYGTLGDALFELGHVRRADAAYQDMIDRRPDVGSYVRASYSAQSHGNYDAAIHALRLALDAAPPTGEEPAFIHHQLGDVFATLGDYERAERVNRIGTRLAPGFVPPTVGIAESYIARGRYEEALPIMERAARDLPALEYLVTLGDLYTILGAEDAASETYDRAAQRFALYRASDVLPDHDFVLFYADHGLRTRAALEEARAIYENRPTAAAADTLAWALHATGRDEEALLSAREAMRGTRPADASILFHAASIADGLGDTENARSWARAALRLDPRFSLFHLDEAERLAR